LPSESPVAGWWLKIFSVQINALSMPKGETPRSKQNLQLCRQLAPFLARLGLNCQKSGRAVGIDSFLSSARNWTFIPILVHLFAPK
jgi:hypothetical protein